MSFELALPDLFWFIIFQNVFNQGDKYGNVHLGDRLILYPILQGVHEGQNL
jgi:hypothetical protein